MADLFSLSATTPAGGMVHGDAVARGEVQASALLRRGVDLRAGFDLAASLRGALGDGIAAKVAAGVGAQAGIALQAAIPLDLFHEAGVVARFQAQAAAAAWVNASLSLSPEVFRARVEALVPAPLDELLDVFMDEVVFSAGLWARAAFAAEIRGEAVLTGSLLRSANRDAGFSFAMRYAAGLAYGAGKEFVANVGFPDPGRLLDRLGDRMVAVVLRAAEQALAAQPEATRVAAAPALAVLRVLLPLGMRAALRAGLGLIGAGGAQRRAAATGGVVDALTQSAQYQLLEALGALAFERLADLLDPATALGSLATDPAKSAQVRAELVALRDRLAELDELEPADASAWLAGVLAVLGPLGRLLDLGLAPGAGAEVRHALALLWSAAVLLERVGTWYDDPARAVTGLFGELQVAAPEDGGFAAVVAAAAGRPAGTSLRLQDLLAFLLGVEGLVADLRAAVPALAAGLDAIEALTGSPAALAVQELLVDLAAPGADRAKALLDRLAATAGPLARDEVVAKVLDPLKAAHPHDEGLHRLVDELVTPTLLGLPAVVLPNLAGATTDQGALRLREALSAVLLQPLALYTLAGVDVLLDHALTEGQQALRDAAALVEQVGEAWGGFGALLILALEAPLPVQVTPEEARVLLELAADIAKGVNEHQREPVMDGLRALTRLGFESAAGREASLATLLSSDDPPDQARLDAALVRVRDGSWEVVKLVAPKALELLAAHYLGVVKALATAVASGARALVEAAAQGLALLGAALAELLGRLEELGRQALALAGQFAGQVRALAERAKTFTETVIERIRAAGRALLDPLLTPLPMWAADALRGLYDSLFDEAKWVLTTPLGLLAEAAGLVEEACKALATLDVAAVKQEIRRRILGSTSSDLHFDLALWLDPPPVLGYDAPPFKLFDLGRVTIPAGWALSAVADVLLGDALVGQKLAEAAATQGSLRTVAAEEATVRQLAKGVEGQQAAQADAARLTPGDPLAVHFIVPADQQVLVGMAGLRIRIDGANATFVRPTLGVQPRVVVRVNGRTWHYDPASWVEQAGGLELAAVLVPLLEPAPTPIDPGPRADAQLVVEQPTGVYARFERAGGELHLAFSVPEAPPVAVPGLPLGPPRLRTERVPAMEVLGGPARALRASSAALRAGDGDAAAPQAVRSVGAATFTDRPLTLTEADPQAEAEAEAVALGLDPYGTPVLAGHVGLNAMQVAVADGAGQEAGERLLFFLEGDPRKVTIIEVAAKPPEVGVPDESVAIRNDGPDDVDLTGWTLRSLAQDSYEFRPFTLRTGQTARVWTGAGADDEENLYWDRPDAVWWSHQGGTAILADATGRDISRLAYTPERPR